MNGDLRATIDQAASTDAAGVFEDTLKHLRTVKTKEALKLAATMRENRGLFESVMVSQFARGAEWMMQSLTGPEQQPAE
jgi:hypothetical protein